MKHITSLLLLSSTVAALPELSLAKKRYSDFGDLSDAISSRLFKRATGTDSTNVYSIVTYSTGGAYYANVTIGTPPQEQVVILDTGSSDLYFDASTAVACQSKTAANSCRGGTFNPANSKTYKIVKAAPAFNTAFGDGSTASGPFSTDVFGLGDVSISNVQFGVAEKVNSTTGYAVGLMGVGYSLNEATKTKYPNVPEVLKDAGVIQSRLYSVYLNDANYGSGSILFGGVDTSKYTGNLVSLDLLADPNYDEVFEFITTVTGLTATLGSQSSTIVKATSDGTRFTSDVLPVLLDTGSAAWSVPQSTYDKVNKIFSFVDSDGYCPCSYRDSGASLKVTFGGKVDITVPAQEFIIPVYDPSTNEPLLYNKKGDLACAFMLGPSSYSKDQPFLTLGDAILRSMYVVFDLDNGQVSIAQANVNSTSASKIVEVGRAGVAAAISGVAAIPAQTNSIAAQIAITQSFVASTAASTIGTATGIDAVPTDARPTTLTGAAASTSTSKAAAADHSIPSFNWGGILSLGWATVMAFAGAALL